MARNHISINILLNQTHRYDRPLHSFGQWSRCLPRHIAPLKDCISVVVRIRTVMFKIVVPTFILISRVAVTLLLWNIGKFLHKNNASYLTVEGNPDGDGLWDLGVFVFESVCLYSPVGQNKLFIPRPHVFLITNGRVSLSVLCESIIWFKVWIDNMIYNMSKSYDYSMIRSYDLQYDKIIWFTIRGRTIMFAK